MKKETKDVIIGFSVYNQYVSKNEIIWIALELCKKYGWSTEEIASSRRRFDPIEHCEYEYVEHNEKNAWKYTVKAAYEEHDVYAIATLMFFKDHSPVIEETEFHTNNESVLIELVEILEKLEDKDAFVYFLIGRANFCGRGAELNHDRARECFILAADGGFEIARLFAYEIDSDFDSIFVHAKRLIEELPDSHIVRFYLGLCYYYGVGTETNYERVTELFGYTRKITTYNQDPVDYYFLTSRYLLGACYFHGYAVERDLGVAEDLFRFSSAEFNLEAKYAQAISALLSGRNVRSGYIFSLLEASALKGYLPAVRKVMLCLRTGYGTERDKERYIQYSDYYDHEKGDKTPVSDLGYEADHCDLVDHEGNMIKDDELD